MAGYLRPDRIRSEPLGGPDQRRESSLHQGDRANCLLSASLRETDRRREPALAKAEAMRNQGGIGGVLFPQMAGKQAASSRPSCRYPLAPHALPPGVASGGWPSRLSQIGFGDGLWQKQPVASLLPHATGLLQSALSTSPEKIPTYHALYGAAGILSHHQTAQRLVAGGPARLQPERRPQRQMLRVDRKGASGGQRNTLSPNRTRSLQETEKDEALVAVHQLFGARRIGAQPVADCLHRGLVSLEHAFLDQGAADRVEGTAVGAGKADAHLAPFIDLHHARALNMQEEGVYRIAHPDDFFAAAVEVAVFEGCTGRIGLQAPVLYPSDEAFRRQVGTKLAQIHFDEIAGTAVEGYLIAGLAGEGALQLGFVVAGEEAVRRLSIEDGQRSEMALQDVPEALVVAGGKAIEVAAGRLPVTYPSGQSLGAKRPLRRLCQQALAGASQRRQRFRQRVAFPAREFPELGCPQAQAIGRARFFFRFLS